MPAIQNYADKVRAVTTFVHHYAVRYAGESNVSLVEAFISFHKSHGVCPFLDPAVNGVSGGDVSLTSN